MPRQNKRKKTNSIISDYTFVARVSHHLRTPAAIMKESIELLLDEIPGSLNDKQRRILNICKSNVGRFIKEMHKVLKQLHRHKKYYENL